ncbi:MAG TPA: NFACT RNA binding domain-containing protein [Polyangia bacterium]|nr:NFACT RNA binding domain-containing protein [Polyangia bacterium]
MTLRARELSSVCEEISRVLVGRPVQKIVQPDRATVMLGMQRSWLVASADARLGRLHLDEKPAGTGEAAPPFCMQLRKELTGARLVSCAAVEGERAAELLFERAGERRKLWLILFGRAAQLELVDERGAILGAIGPAREPYASLPEPRAIAPNDDREADRFGESPSEKIAAHYREAAHAEAAREAKTRALGEARAAIKRFTRLERALSADRARAEAAVEKRKLGDLLLAHLGEIPRGAASVTLPDDFEGGAPIAIALDPARSARENAARFYKEHKRLSRALASIDARLAEARRRRAEAEATLARLDGATAEQAASWPRPERAEKKRGKMPQRRLPPYREFRAATGAAILVGRGADRNDELTFQVARGSDLWLHARDVPGAHVVVPLEGGRPVDGETLLDAATLAAYHSNARGEPQVDIGYTLRKNVRKPPRSRPGLVTTSALKTLRVRVEPARLERLLASRADER